VNELTKDQNQSGVLTRTQEQRLTTLATQLLEKQLVAMLVADAIIHNVVAAQQLQP
jgi:hypothetical protein